jgi:endonuclease YncB( thermonuclease family)
VSNSGTADLVIGTVASADPLAAPFSIVTDDCSGETISPGGNRTLTVRFGPTANGSFSDSFDIPSNDPNTPSVIVTLTGATPNTAPTAPVVNITPDSPTTADDLICSITTQSTDADGDTITYTYQWYKDSVLQPALTTNTVAAANTAKGQVWRCMVTPNDGTVNGPSAEDQVTIQNSAPTAPVVVVTPDNPDTAADLVCSIATQSTDADGDTVSYTYQWYRDGAVQSALTTNTVPAADTTKGQVWQCVVTANDGTINGSPAEDEVTVQNSAPAAPVVAITPDSPGSGADLVCGISTQSADADGDAITYTYQWYKDGVLQSALTTNTVAAAETAYGQVWRCVVTPSDGTASGPSAEDEVTVTGSAGGFPAGAIAGIVIGVLVLAAAAAFFWFRHSKKAPLVS